jgi:hypothetical protein
MVRTQTQLDARIEEAKAQALRNYETNPGMFKRDLDWVESLRNAV